MKQQIAIILAFLMLVWVTGCSNASNTETTQDYSTQAGTEDSMIDTTVENTTGTTSTTDRVTDPTVPNDGNASGEGGPETEETGIAETVHLHNFGEIITAPTCTNEGYTTYTCVCGERYVSNKVTAAGHNFGEWSTLTEPTTTATGIAERKCDSCGTKETKTLGKLIENHAHSYTSKVTKNATCTQEGIRTFSCSCGDSYTESIAKTNHSYKTNIVPADCVNGGYTTHKCSACGDSYTDAHTKALGHAYSSAVVKPTCAENGYTKHTCSRCKKSYTNSTVNATGHNYVFTSDTANCTANGIKTETCNNCGNKKTSATSALGHVYSNKIVKPTCTESGYTEHTCSRCKTSYKDSVVKATGHTIKTETVNATCVTDGYIKETCTICKTIVSNTTISANGTHKWETTVAHTAGWDYYYKYEGQWHAARYCNKYNNYKEWVVEACSVCCLIDEDSFRHAYTAYDAAVIMLGYVNDLRAEVYGTHAYDLILDDKLLELAKIRSKEISINYSHFGGTYTNAGENITGGQNSTIYSQFCDWKESSGHYENMIEKTYKYFGYAIYNDDSVRMTQYGVQLFWSESKKDMYYN